LIILDVGKDSVEHPDQPVSEDGLDRINVTSEAYRVICKKEQAPAAQALNGLTQLGEGTRPEDHILGEGEVVERIYNFGLDGQHLNHK
jgi:hypothetical protein